MHAKKKSMSMKVVVLLLAVVLLIGWVAGGTIAFLMTKSTTVTNTFVVGTIGNLTLNETKGTEKNGSKEFLIIPGKDIEKDPKVTFTGNNVDAYVFVKVDANGWTLDGNTKTYSIISANDEKGQMSWTVDSAWAAVPDVEHVYYKEVAVSEVNREWSIISGDAITVNSNITEASIGDYAKNLAFTAYAIQQDGFDGNVAAAWNQAKDAT